MNIRNALLGTTLAVTLAMAGGSAFSADLMQHKGVMAAQDPGTQGNYVTIFGGYALSGDLQGQTTEYQVYIPEQAGYTIGGAIGTRILPNVRGEVELSYVHKGINTDQAQYEGSTSTASGSYNTLYALGNIWYDINLGSSITPYVGGGAGLAVIMPNFNEEDGDPYTVNAVAFAGQVGAGIRYAIADNMTLDLGYRAKATFNGTLTNTDGASDQGITGINHLDQTVQLGLSVGF